jgi:hypothetical protein
MTTLALRDHTSADVQPSESSLLQLQKMFCIEQHNLHRAINGQVPVDLKDCKHQHGVWSFRPNDAHVIEHHVLNVRGDEMFLVCSDCSLAKDNFLGVPVQVHAQRQGDYEFNCKNPSDIGTLIPFIHCSARTEGDKILVNRGIHGFNGVKRRPSHTKRITISIKQMPRFKRTSIAKVLKNVMETTNMEFSGEQRVAICAAVDAENKKRTQRNQL